jgi:glycosyltransferase involved in cell wall biosynthesis
MTGCHRADSGNQLVAFVAAHNEEQSIGAALGSLADQSRRPDRIIVVADRCTDRTAEIAIDFGVEVFETSGNRHRKAGALNQALAAILPSLDAADSVLLMDADTELSPIFLAAAELRLRTSDEGRPAVGAVGAVFLAEQPVAKSVQVLQRNEYLRYAHDVQRRKGRAEVVSGTAGVFPVAVLRDVAAERGRLLPAAEYVFDNNALTEDNELTVAIKHLGYRCASPSECTVQTELMPTLKTLYFQRVRWQRGALENLRTYGVTTTTIPYILRQLLIHIGIVFVPFFITVLLIACVQTASFPWSWPWLFLSLIVLVERAWTVRRGGPRAVTLAALVLPELLYDLFIHAVFVRALVDAIGDARAHWDHQEARQAKVPGVITQMLRIVFHVFIPVVVVGIAIVLAVLADLAGVQWIVVGAIVGAGIAHSALRTTRLDPMGLVFGRCDNPPKVVQASPTRLDLSATARDLDKSDVMMPVSPLSPPLILLRPWGRAHGADIGITPPDIYEMPQLALRNETARVLPNGVCLRPPLSDCDQGHACISCGHFATNFIHLAVLRRQLAETEARNTTGRDQYRQRSGREVSEDNVQILQRRREILSLRAIIGHIQSTARTSRHLNECRIP